MAKAREDLERAQRLRPRLTHAVPFYAVQSRLELIRVRIALMDVRGVKELLREVNDVLRRRPDLGILREQTDRLGAWLDTIRTDVVGASALTAAELRVLPLLATHHSFREIGERLQTVATHRQDAGDSDLPEIGRIVPKPRDQARAGPRLAHAVKAFLECLAFTSPE